MRFHFGVVARRLRAIGTIFGAAARFYGQQCANLHFLRVVVLAVDGGGAVNQIQHGRIEYAGDLLAGPVVADHVVGGFRVV